MNKLAKYFQSEMIRLFDREIITSEALRLHCFELPQFPEPAKIYGEITAEQLAAILPQTYVLNGQTYYTRRYARDVLYQVTTIDEVKRFLKWDLTDRRQYVSEYDDCDNFQGILYYKLQAFLYGRIKLWTPGIPVGMADVPGHAKNIGVAYSSATDLRLVPFTIEPQSDAMTFPPDPVVTMWWV